jgi:hypothetical protein
MAVGRRGFQYEAHCSKGWLICLILLAPPVAAADFAVGGRGVFDRPKVGGVALDWCVSWATQCGQPAADGFCRTQGYQRSIGYLTYSAGRTSVAGQLCEGDFCGGFLRIECDQGVPGQGGSVTSGRQTRTTLTCQFTQGPLAGRTIDYTGYPGAVPGPVGQPCSDGAASSGVAIAADSPQARNAVSVTASANNPFNPPVEPVGAERAASTSKADQSTNGSFPFPQINGVAVDGCARYAQDCGQGGADQFCRTQGFASASRWNWAYDQRTWVIGSNRYCETGPGVNCGGLRDVVCSSTTAGNAPVVTTTPPVTRPAAPATDREGPMAGRFTSSDFGNVIIRGGPTEYTGEYEVAGNKGTFNVAHAPDSGANTYRGSWEGGGDSGALSLTLQDDGNVYGGWNLHNQFGTGGGNVWTRVR